MDKLNNKKVVTGLVGMWVLLFVFMSFTNPEKLSAVLLISPVAWLFVCLFATVYAIQNYLSGRRMAELSIKNIGFSAVVALLPTSLLLLKSINQLTTKDLVLMGVFVGITFNYVRRFKFSHKIE
mgnify:CR=1 FL=1